MKPEAGRKVRGSPKNATCAPCGEVGRTTPALYSVQSGSWTDPFPDVMVCGFHLGDVCRVGCENRVTVLTREAARRVE